MKWSMFIFKVEADGKVLLYNTFNYAVVLFEQDVFNKIDAMVNNGLLDESEEVKALIEQEFLISKIIDEKEQFMQILKAEHDDDSRMCLQILTTTGCNFKCPYCYQEGICREERISLETIRMLEVFLEKYISKNNKIKKIFLILHGGEPTTNWKHVPEIFEMIHRICEKFTLDYDTQIITNGYLLTKEKIDLLVANNLRNVQITIDGIGKITDMRRAARNGVPTFDTIISNIHKLLETNTKGKVRIRINYDKQNAVCVSETIEFLAKEFADERVEVTLGYITKTMDTLESNPYIDQYGIQLSELVDYYPEFHRKLREAGYTPENLLIFDGLCVSKMKHNMVISPSGEIYKCPSGVGIHEFVEGNIHNGEEKVRDYLFYKLYDYCFEEKCPFIPLCQTSCRFLAAAKNGAIDSIDCKREALEKVNIKLLKDQYMT